VPDALPTLSGNPATERRTFAIDAAAVAQVDEWIATVGQRWEVGEQTTFAARLCVAELFANVLEHGAAKPGGGDVIVTLTRRADGLGVAFSDPGMPFDPTTAVMPEQGNSVASATVSGRGLMLLRAYARDLAHHHDGAGNHLTFWVVAR